MMNDQPLSLYCDNKPTINIAYNPDQYEQTTHIEIDRNFIKAKLNDKTLCILFI